MPKYCCGARPLMQKARFEQSTVTEQLPSYFQNFQNMPERTRIRSRYETEYKANFRPPDLQKVYSPPKLRPRGIEELLQREGLTVHHDNPHGTEEATEAPVDKRRHDTPHIEHETVSRNNPECPRPSKDQQQGTDRPPSDRGLRYRAGQSLQMPRPIRQNFVSEYQRQFNWKNLQNHESPMLSADKMVYASQAEVPAPTKNIKMPLKTEYQVQFTEFPTFEHRRADRQAAAGESKQKPVKTKPLKEITKRSSDDEPFMKPAHKSPVVHSEYLSNFQPPSKYRYVKGAWLGAAPPHLMPSGDTLEEKCVSMVRDDAWYQQVLELRQRACSYKNRALGDSEFLHVLRKLGDEQSQILKRAQDNSAPPSNCAVENVPPLGKKRASDSGELGSDRRHSEDLGCNRRHSEDLGSNRRHSEDVDEVVSITQSDNQSDHSF